MLKFLDIGTVSGVLIKALEDFGYNTSDLELLKILLNYG